ncbi:MAG: ribosome maturation factor RimM [Chloroflexota bacterium]|nr:ribosome maturation factor RimM [Chloroflexota bacterium]
MAENPPYLLIGEILRPHGIRGELRMKLHTDYPERIARLEQVYLAPSVGSPQVTPYFVEGMRMNAPYGLLKLRGVEDRNGAERFRGLMVMVDFANAVPLEPGEFYLFQLIGVRVVTDEGVDLGTLREVLETGANDVYIIDSPTYGELLIPVIAETILKTDMEARIVTVHLIDGLLPKPLDPDKA